MFVFLYGKVGHSVLLRSDGSAVAWGSNRLGQCNIPDLVEGVTYTQVSTGDEHTVLLASDGAAAASQTSLSALNSFERHWTAQPYSHTATNKQSLHGADHSVSMHEQWIDGACLSLRYARSNSGTENFWSQHHIIREHAY